MIYKFLNKLFLAIVVLGKSFNCLLIASLTFVISNLSFEIRIH